MKRSFYVYVIILLLGALVVAAPDKGRAVLIFNKEHGPSLLDATGLLLILGAWFLMLSEVWKKRASVVAAFGKKTIGLMILGILLCTAGIVLALQWYQNGLLLLFSTASFVLHLLMVLIAFRNNTIPLKKSNRL